MMELFSLIGKLAIEGIEEANRSLDEVTETGRNTEGKMSGTFSKIGSGAAAVGKTVVKGIAAGATAFTLLTTASVNAAGELEQNIGGSEQVFQQYAENIQDTADDAYKNMGLSASDYLATANKMGALLQGSGFSIKESSELSAEAMQRAADVASIMGIDTESAMEAVAGAAKGNYTMMDNLGVAMNETSLAAYALSQGIEKSTNEMTQQEKTALAMEMFLDKTSYAAGNYAKENETLAGSLGTAKAAWDNFLATGEGVDAFVESAVQVGDIVVNMVTELAPKLVDGVVKLINGLIPQLPKLIQSLLPVIVEGGMTLIFGLVNAFLANIGMITDTAVTVVLTLVEGITQALPTLIPAIVQAVITIVQALIENMPMLIDGAIQLMLGLAQGLIDAIPVLIAALPQIITSIVSALLQAIPQIIEAGMQLLTALVAALPEIIQAIVAVLPQIINGILTALLENLPILVQAGIDIFVALVQALPTIIIEIAKAIPDIIDGIITALMEHLPELIQAGVDLFIALVENLPTIISEISKAIPEIIATIVSGIVSSVPKLAQAGLDLIKGLWQGISDAGAWLWDKISGFLGGVVDDIKDFFGIKSPSRLMAGIGRFLGEGIGVGFEESMESVSDDMQNAIPDTLEGPDIDVKKIIPASVMGGDDTQNVGDAADTLSSPKDIYSMFMAALENFIVKIVVEVVPDESGMFESMRIKNVIYKNTNNGESAFS